MKTKHLAGFWALGLWAYCALPVQAASAAETMTYVYVSGEELPTLRGVPPSKDTETRINTGKLQFFCSKALLSSADFATATATTAATLQRCESVRRISERTDQIEVRRIAVGDAQCASISGPQPEVTFKEDKRRTMFADGLKTLLGFAFKKITDAPDKQVSSASPPPPLQWCVSEPTRHLLQLDRSTLTISAQYPASKLKKEAEKKPEDQIATVQLITGPAEHFFLSGDAVVRGADEVKWDAATRTLVARDKPDQLYLGVNYMVGDVYAKHDAWSTDRFVYKLMFQPSKKPFDSVGLALGYRFADGIFSPGAAADNGGFMVFAGAFWTRTDQLDAAGAVVGGRRERSVRVGVSYSLGTLLEWLK